MTRSRVPATSPAALSRRGSTRPFFISAPNATYRFRGARREIRRRRARRITWFAPACSTTRRKRRKAIATCWGRCVRARCSWFAPIRHGRRNAAIPWSIALEPWLTPMRRRAATCFIAASRMRRSTTLRGQGGEVARRCGAVAPPRARHRRFGTHRSQKAQRLSGLDYIFVTSGIHAEEYGSRDAPDLAALNAIFKTAGVAPKAVMRELVW